MARGIQPTAQQLAEERSITLQAATAELKTWDRYEADLLTHLSHELSDDPQLLAIAKRLQRGDALENSDHAELYDAVRAG